MKILAVGLNYESHNIEMKRTFSSSEPVIFMKPESAQLKDGKPFFIPDFTSEVHYETEIVVKINRLGKHIAEGFAHRYYNEITVGIDFTARDLQRNLKEKGLPWELAKGFDHSAAIGKFILKQDFADIQNINFHLDINSETVQHGNTRDMIYSIDKIISYVSKFFTLKIGDLIFTGTPAGVGPVEIDDHLEGYIEDLKLLDFNVK
ncbi:MAG: fumarylacetoacetate hydrolase family protein [Dysgonamonadaceae bacterium]|jgi:2-keto-4-pentenoate hydratase/2-oxohepta-3-ene-1,7-dioic acid hydratase in catechol pathway|nr:fumarylacetoacetate hydrolase family protein [Dysgonamonadaceae bacterium]MDD3356768.1 fumarylacetoacetate hydrolase family protein [Dysgonamonadaceae bacterium]MDD4246488.1 fumarylacetoacetate hydrolase family protein [Dysgonamonadaceae bacterium]MDD4606189.1 fumarylacetoacetate hydrolase family protein [Dysgonamonadaceae bacterium]HUI32078.1 fumarylacetoacetate hydrolase family protein [Dysgonamonadaceae bacterium]